MKRLDKITFNLQHFIGKVCKLNVDELSDDEMSVDEIDVGHHRNDGVVPSKSFNFRKRPF